MAKQNNLKNSSGILAGFKLTLLSALFYILVSLVMLIFLNFRAVWIYILQSITGTVDQSALRPLTDNLLNFMGKLDTPALMLFWAGFGVLVFGIIWVIQNIFFTVGREVEESRYLRGGVMPVNGYWYKAMESNFWVIIMVFLWIAYAALYISFLLPLASKLFFVALYDPSLSKELLDIAVAVLINSASLFLFWNIQLALTASWRATRG